MEEFVDIDGVTRKLGWLPPSTDHHRMARQSTTSIQTLRTAQGLPPLVDPKFYKPRDFVTPFGRKVINNQQSCSGCTGWSGIQAFRRQRLIRGMEDHDFSGAFAYAMINGGRDDGSVIVDCMASLEKNGVCLRSEFDYPKLYKSQVPQSCYESAKRFRLLGRCTVDTSAECATALQMGFIPSVPVRVDRHFNVFDGDGVVQVSPGTQANHAIHLAGQVWLRGAWFFLVPNTWGLEWGPFVRSKPEWAGCVLLPFASIDNCDYEDDGYAHVDSTWDGAQAA